MIVFWRHRRTSGSMPICTDCFFALEKKIALLGARSAEVASLSFKEKLYRLNFPKDNNWLTDFLLHSTRVVYCEENCFWKEWFLSQVKAEKKENGCGCTIFTVEVNGDTCNCNWKKSVSQNLSETNRNIFIKICRPYKYKANKVVWLKFTVPICFL